MIRNLRVPGRFTTNANTMGGQKKQEMPQSFRLLQKYISPNRFYAKFVPQFYTKFYTKIYAKFYARFPSICFKAFFPMFGAGACAAPKIKTKYQVLRLSFRRHSEIPNGEVYMVPGLNLELKLD